MCTWRRKLYLLFVVAPAAALHAVSEYNPAGGSENTRTVKLEWLKQLTANISETEVIAFCIVHQLTPRPISIHFFWHTVGLYLFLYSAVPLYIDGALENYVWRDSATAELYSVALYIKLCNDTIYTFFSNAPSIAVHRDS